MALPIVETPRYELTLPSQETKVQYRPFLVKEEKILYVALESGDEKEMQQATKQILKFGARMISAACPYYPMMIVRVNPQ